MKVTPYRPIVRVVKLRRVCVLHTARRASRRKHVTQNIGSFKERDNLGHSIVRWEDNTIIRRSKVSREGVKWFEVSQ